MVLPDVFISRQGIISIRNGPDLKDRHYFEEAVIPRINWAAEPRETGQIMVDTITWSLLEPSPYRYTNGVRIFVEM